ncbi:MAG: DOMON domain-containing protein, partial [Rectinemataceae bacterium]|nr:DOMON domain-containing protein [Rectinemataceae bacterium]
CLLFAMIGPLAAQPAGQAYPLLKASAHVPVADGVVASGEYAWQATLKDMKLALSLSADSSTLHVALEAPTAGWVAVGLGSLKMNGSFMVLAYVDKGSAAVSEQTGIAFGHKENASKILRSQAVQEANGATVLEYSLPATAYTAWPSLKLIVAYGRPDNFSSKHVKYEVAEIGFAK